MYYREIDSNDGSDLEKRFSELVSLYGSGMIEKQEFLNRRWILKSNMIPEFDKFNISLN